MNENIERTPYQQQVTLIEGKIKVENQFKGGASNFFWIAALSLINSIILLVGGSWSFFIGLGITQLIDGLSTVIATEIGSNAGIIVRIVAFAVDMGIAGIFVSFGILARKGYKWSFIVGMILYALDGLIFLIVPDFLSIGFHLFILYGLYNALKAMGKLREMEQGTSAI